MVLKNVIRITKAISGFIILVFCFSCEEVRISLINCYECTVEEPTKAKLEIKLEKLGKYSVANPTIYIEIYEGNLENGVMYKSIQTTNSETTFNVPLNKKYTVTARYHINGNYYVAVNSVTPRVKYDEDNCEEPCYYVTGNSVNLRLKYTK